MRITYSVDVDVAYIYLKDDIKEGEVALTVMAASLGAGHINLDFNVKGVLLGIEVLGASKKLPQDLLKLANES